MIPTVAVETSPAFDPLSIALEFAEDPQPGRRRNVASALRAVGGVDPSRRLVAMALREADRRTYEHIRDQLDLAMKALVDPGDLKAIVEELLAKSEHASQGNGRGLLLQASGPNLWREYPDVLRRIVRIALDATDLDYRLLAKEQVLRTSGQDANRVLEQLETLADERGSAPGVHRLLIDMHKAQIGRDVPLVTRVLVDAVVGHQSDLTVNERRGLEPLLSTLRPIERDVAAARLRELLGDQDARDEVYLLLGRLRRRGSPLGQVKVLWRAVPQPWLSLWGQYWRRFRQSWGIASEAQAVRWNLMSPSLGLGIIGATLMAVDAPRQVAAALPARFYPTLFLGACAIAVGLVLAATRRGTPLHLHYDLAVATAASVLRVWFYALIIVAGGALCLLATTNVKYQDALFLCVVVPVFVGMVRLGSALAFRARPPYPDRPAWLERLVPMRRSPNRNQLKNIPWWPTAVLQVLAGASWGLLFLYAVRMQLVHHAPPAWFLSLPLAVDGVWLFVTPAAGALAAAFSTVDWWGEDLPAVADGPEDRSGRGWDGAAAVVSLAFAAACLYILGVTAPRLLAVRWSSSWPMAELGVKTPLPPQVIGDPRSVSMTFAASFPQSIRAEVVNGDGAIRFTTFALPASGIDSDNRPICPAAELTEAAMIGSSSSERVQWGCYRVEASLPQVAAGPGWPVEAALHARVGALRDGRNSSDAFPFFRLTLNELEERVRPTVVQAGEERRGVTDAESWVLPSNRVLNITLNEKSVLQANGNWLPDVDLQIAEVKASTRDQEPTYRSLRRSVRRASSGFVGRPQGGFLPTGEPRDVTFLIQSLQGQTREPGDYNLRQNGAAPMGLELLVFALVEGGPHESSVRERSTAWTFSSVPFTTSFRLTSAQFIRATIPVYSRDVTLELRGEKGVIGVSDDDPELLERQLEPGEYQLSVAATNDSTNTKGEGVLTLLLNANRQPRAFSFP